MKTRSSVGTLFADKLALRDGSVTCGGENTKRLIVVILLVDLACIVFNVGCTFDRVRVKANTEFTMIRMYWSLEEAR